MISPTASDKQAEDVRRQNWNHNMNTLVRITLPGLLMKIREAAEAHADCALYSMTHPETPMRQNPYVTKATLLHQRATGSIFHQWICAAGTVMPQLNDDLTCLCCDGEIYEI